MSNLNNTVGEGDARAKLIYAKFRLVDTLSFTGDVIQGGNIDSLTYFGGKEKIHRHRRLRLIQSVKIMLLRGQIEECLPYQYRGQFSRSTFLLASPTDIYNAFAGLDGGFFTNVQTVDNTIVKKVKKLMDQKRKVEQHVLIESDRQIEAFRRLVQLLMTRT